MQLYDILVVNKYYKDIASYIDSIEKMEKKSEFNLSKILDETTNKLKEAFPDARKYLLELSKEELQTRLTSGRALEIAKTLLEKIGVKADSR